MSLCFCDYNLFLCLISSKVLCLLCDFHNLYVFRKQQKQKMNTNTEIAVPGQLIQGRQLVMFPHFDYIHGPSILFLFHELFLVYLILNFFSVLGNMQRHAEIGLTQHLFAPFLFCLSYF